MRLEAQAGALNHLAIWTRRVGVRSRCERRRPRDCPDRRPPREVYATASGAGKRSHAHTIDYEAESFADAVRKGECRCGRRPRRRGDLAGPARQPRPRLSTAHLRRDDRPTPRNRHQQHLLQPVVRCRLDYVPDPVWAGALDPHVRVILSISETAAGNRMLEEQRVWRTRARHRPTLRVR